MPKGTSQRVLEMPNPGQLSVGALNEEQETTVFSPKKLLTRIRTLKVVVQVVRLEGLEVRGGGGRVVQEVVSEVVCDIANEGSRHERSSNMKGEYCKEDCVMQGGENCSSNGRENEPPFVLWEFVMLSMHNKMEGGPEGRCRKNNVEHEAM